MIEKLGVFILISILKFTSCQESCTFGVNPEKIYSINETIEIGTELFDFEFKSPESVPIKFTEVSGSFADLFRNKFYLEQKSEGYATVVVNDNLSLPLYPSMITKVYLTIHVECSGRDYSVGIVQVNNVNNYQPEFFHFTSNITISETTTANTTFPLDTIVIDFDPSPVYDIVIENDPNDIFTVEEIPGVVINPSLLPLDLQNLKWLPEQLPHKYRLRMLKQLSYGFENHTYPLKIIAKDSFGQSGYSASTQILTVIITDFDDRPPQFSRKEYRANLSSNHEVGMAIVFDFPIEARDGDDGINVPLKYSLVFDRSGLEEYFAVDTNVPRVRLKQKLPVSLQEISFRIRAEQSDNPAMESSANLFISIDNGNNNANCSHNTIENISVSIDSPVGLKIYQLPTQGNLGGLNDKTDSFIIDYNTGWLVLNRSNFTTNDSAILHFKVYYTNGNGTCITLNVFFTDDKKTDQNESRITFDRDHYSVSVGENIVNKDITTIAANNLEKKELEYRILSSNDSDSFSVNPKTGEIRIVEPLDFERKHFYNLSLVACEKTVRSMDRPSKCARTQVEVTVLDINDNRPKFDKDFYNIQIPKDLSTDSPVAFIHASDNDSFPNGVISYILRTPTSLFKLDYNTGLLSLADSIRDKIDSQFELEIEAFDHGIPQLTSTTRVVITVNGSNPNAPEFDKFFYSAILEENSPMGTFVAKVHAIDADNDSVEYFIPQEAGHEFFEIDSKSGVVTTTSIPLDFEFKHELSIIIEARDNSIYPRSSTTLLTVKVIDQNDNSPIFPPLPDNIFISNAKSPGDVILTLNAYDKDGWENGYNKIRFSIEPQSSEFGFLNEFSNQIVLKTKLNEGQYRINLHMEDSGVPVNKVSHQLNIVVLPGLNHYPLFKSLSTALTVDSSAKFPQLLYTFKAETAAGSVEYFILNGPEESLSLDRNTGQLYAYEKILDSLSVEPIQFIVRAVNTEQRSRFSDVSVIIGRLKSTNIQTVHFPFPQYRAELDEEAELNTVMNVTIQAIPYSTELAYTIYPNDTFAIDNNGEIRVVGRIDAESLDPKLHGIITALVVATNSNETASTSLQVKIYDINEFAPEFERPYYSLKVYEDTPSGSLLTELIASDRDVSDKKLIYSIVEGPGSKYIDISDKHNGLVYKSDKSFDSDREDNINITVDASDNRGKMSSTVLNLQVVKRDVQTPQFVCQPYKWTIVEGNSSVGQNFSLAVKGVSNITFKLLYGNRNNSFSLKYANNSAFIYVAKPLDRESFPFYTLAIEAKEIKSGSSTITTVEVNVADVNDNAPIFYQFDYQSTIPADFPLDYGFVTVFATDPDSDSNLTFRLLDNKSGVYKINPANGEISLAKAPVKATENYTLVVVVSDGLFESQVNVTIGTVWNKNLTEVQPTILPPQFDQAVYEFNIPEGETNVSIGQIKILNVGENPIALSIQPDFYQSFFWISNETGEIFTKKNISYMKEVSSYSFMILAEENGWRTFTQVVATVKDKNDHEPVFSQHEFVGLLPSNSLPGYMIKMGIQATDKDFGNNAQIKYTLNGTDAHCFGIDDKIGNLNLKCAIDPSVSSYSFNVIATDQNGFGLSSVAPVHILVHISEQNNQTEFIIESTSRAVTKPDQTFKTTIATSNPVFTSESSVSNNVTKSLEFMGNYTTYSTGSSTTNAPLSFTTFSPIPISVCCDNTSSAASLVTNIVEPENFTRISSHAPIPVTICCLNESIATSGESSTNGNHSPTNIFTTTIQPIRTTSEINSTNMTMYVTEVSTPINLINSTATPSPVPISFCCNNESTSSNYTTGTTSKIEFNETATKGSTPSNSTILMTPSSFFPIKTSTVTNFGTSTNGGFSNIQSSTVAPSKYTTESISTKRIQNETGIFTSTDYYSSEILTTNTAYVSTKLPFTSGQNIVEHNCSLKFVTAMEKLSLIEHSPIATPIYVAMVVPDGHLCNVTYSLEGLAKDYFDMNPLSGLIKISKDLDITALLSQQLIDPNGVFELTVKAHSGNGETETKLTMTVVKFPPNSANLGDVHFNRSVYIFNVSENQPNGTFVGFVTAMANATGITYTILFSKQFSVDTNSGELKTTLALDYELGQHEFSFLVKASQGSSSDYASILAYLNDENDHEPEFVELYYKFEIPEAPYSVPSFVGHVKATDKDNGNNSDITYSIYESDLPFKIDPKSGIIVVIGNIDRESIERYSFTVIATDGGIPSLSSNVTVNVTILDVNDNSPEFQNTPFTVSLNENSQPNQEVTRVYANDSDSGFNGKVLFDLITNTDVFTISSEDGVIRLIKPLSLKSQDHYVVTVVAYDLGKPSRKTYFNISVNVIESSENRPRFKQDFYFAEIFSDAISDQAFLQLSAGNKSLRYSLDESSQDLFAINNATGQIYLRRKIREAEANKGYTLAVTAINTTTGEKDTTKVRIFVMKGSAAAGTTASTETTRGFRQSQYWIDMMENLPPPQLVMDLNSTYESKGIPVRYMITSGNADKFFINESTGQVYALQPMDRENRSLYILTVKVTPLAKRKAREVPVIKQFAEIEQILKLDSNEAAIVINVTDQNDEKPEFDQGSFGVVLTMNPSSEFGSIIGTVNAFDKDLNPHLSYEIIRKFSDDSTRFRIDPETGVVLAGRNFKDIREEKFHFVVSAFDGVFTTFANVTVYKLSQEYLAIVQSYATLEIIKAYATNLEREFSKLTALEITISKVTQRVSNENSVKATSNRLEISIYGIDPVSRIPVNSDILVKKVNEVLPQVAEKLKNLRLLGQSETAKSFALRSPMLLSVAEATLIAICAVVVASAIIGAILLIKWWNRNSDGNSSQTYTSTTAVTSETAVYDSDTIDRKRQNKKILRTRTQIARCALVPSSYLERCNQLRPTAANVPSLYEEISESGVTSSENSDAYRYPTRL